MTKTTYLFNNDDLKYRRPSLCSYCHGLASPLLHIRNGKIKAACCYEHLKFIGEGKKMEPIEALTIDLPESVSGKAIEMVTQRKGEMLSMSPKGNRMLCEFTIPSRGIIGLRNQLLTATAGEAIMNHRFI